MSVITIYKCDKCGKEWNPSNEDEQIVNIQLTISFDYLNPRSEFSIRRTQQWCRTCVIKNGIVEPTKTDKKDAQNDPEEQSLADKLSNVISELGFINYDD